MGSATPFAHEARAGLFVNVNHFFVTFGSLLIALYLIFPQMSWQVAVVQCGIGVLLLVLFLIFGSGEESSAPPPEAATPPPVAAPAEVPMPPAGPVAPAPTIPEVATAEAGRLVLEFEQASWVEISDSSGRLLSGEQPAGSRQVLSGQPPFSVALGNAPGVRLSVDGQPWPVPDDARAAGSKVARFRIESLSR